MRMLLLVVAAISFLCTAHATDGRCFVAAIAVNQYNNKNPDVWDSYAEEFAACFQENSQSLFESVQVKTVLGTHATRDNILDVMRWLEQNAGTKDFAAIYIGCHGCSDAKEGWRTLSIDGQIVSGKELKLAAGRLRCPVLFVIDTCGSGGFAHKHGKDVSLPPNAAAICSSHANQTTSNHLSTALHEGMWGQADFNQDGVIELDELIRYIRLRCVELDADVLERPDIVRGESVSSTTRLFQTSNKQFASTDGLSWRLGRTLSDPGPDDKVKVHYADSFSTAEVSRADVVYKLRASRARPVMVEIEKTRAPAALWDIENDNYKVRVYMPGKVIDTVLKKSEIIHIFAEGQRIPMANHKSPELNR